MLSNFYHHPFFWPCLGVAWLVYKFQNRLGSSDPGDPKPDGCYGSQNEARVKTLKKTLNEYPEETVEIQSHEDEHGRFWLIRLVVGALEIIFVPVPPPKQ